MSLKDDLKTRTRWAINFICARDGETNKTLGNGLGVSRNTINSYRQKATAPNIAFAVRFCEQFGLNYQWLISGLGEPYPGAREEHPEVCGPVDDQSLAGVAEPVAPYRGDTPVRGNVNTIDLFDSGVASLRAVFETRNIHYKVTALLILDEIRKRASGERFVPGVLWENEELRKDLSSAYDENKSLRQDLAGLRSELASLKSQFEEMKDRLLKREEREATKKAEGA